MDFDRLLPQIASRLSSIEDPIARLAEFRAALPWLVDQIERDRDCGALFELWGQSVNLDELAGITIVKPTILETIGQLADVPMYGPIVHAGLEHTYGYLLSTIETPYGYKRDRWLSADLEKGFGIPLDSLGPRPEQGTLLANATWLAGNIAFRGDDKAMTLLSDIAPCVSEHLRAIPFDRIRQIRILERLNLKDTRGRFGSVRIRTDLLPFPHAVEGCAANTLLVYSVEDRRTKTTQLITLFTVTPKFVDEVTEPVRFGKSVEIQARFNAFIRGVSGQTPTGRRELLRFDGGKM